MLPYWLIFLVPAWRSLTSPCNRLSPTTFLCLWFVLTLLIGLRYQVGGDWATYIDNYTLNIEGESLDSLIFNTDPSYIILSWLSYKFSTGIYGINFACAGIFSFGLLTFCQAQPRPWVALCISIPYLVIVVAMGYTRQSVSIGLLMPAFIALSKGRLLAFVGWVTSAASFQQTSLITLGFLLPIIPGKSIKDRLIKLCIISTVFIALVQLFLISRVQVFIDGYIGSQQMQSEGAAVRVLMNALPAVLFLLRGRKLGLDKYEYSVWQGMSILAIICVLGLIVVPSSTVVDRIALYAIPLQLFVGSRVADMQFLAINAKFMNLLLVTFSALVLFVWLFFAKTAFAWIPYQNIIWGG